MSHRVTVQSGCSRLVRRWRVASLLSHMLEALPSSSFPLIGPWQGLAATPALFKRTWEIPFLDGQLLFLSNPLLPWLCKDQTSQRPLLRIASSLVFPRSGLAPGKGFSPAPAPELRALPAENTVTAVGWRSRGYRERVTSPAPPQVPS